mmetsp:Transcript_27079/g.71530  ORF Transcript_27079/g.71530 Transcript_27079/m.71530 type:complete len:215 (+) Transcript_27079:306-950(+)
MHALAWSRFRASRSSSAAKASRRHIACLFSLHCRCSSWISNAFTRSRSFLSRSLLSRSTIFAASALHFLMRSMMSVLPLLPPSGRRAWSSSSCETIAWILLAVVRSCVAGVMMRCFPHPWYEMKTSLMVGLAFTAERYSISVSGSHFSTLPRPWILLGLLLILLLTLYTRPWSRSRVVAMPLSCVRAMCQSIASAREYVLKVRKRIPAQDISTL